MQTLPEEQPEETTSLLGRNRDLAVLYAIAGYLNHKVDVHEALQEVLAKVAELLRLRTGWVWLLNERGSPYPAASLALPPYLADHPERMTGSCVCLDTFLSGDMETAANIDVLRCRLARRYALASGRAFTRRRRLLASRRFRSA